MSLLLGLDLGTSSAKGVLLSRAGEAVARAEAAYALDADGPGWAEIDPQVWWEAIVAVVSDLRRAVAEPPAAIGLSGQMHGVVLAAADGTPVRRAMLWPDVRATEELAAYRELPAAIRARLGNPLSPGMAGPLLLWTARHEPETYARARWALQAKDWLRLRLTGEVAAEPSDASATLLYDVQGDGWDGELLERLDLDPRMLAPLVGSLEVAGELGAEAAALGLPAGVPVAAGAGDTAAGIVGSGLPDGRCQLTLGTGGQLVRPAGAPAPQPERGTHTYRAAAPHGWYAMAAILNAGLALEWARRSLAASWEELYASGRRAPRASDPLFLPHLAGERTPYLDPGLRGAWTGLALAHGREDLLRSALEGVALALRDAVDALPGTVDEIRVAGGGSTHPAWRALLADVLDRPLAAVDVAAVSARGAALAGGVAAGLIEPGDVLGRLAPPARPVAEPSPGAAERYAPRLARFRATVRTLAQP